MQENQLIRDAARKNGIRLWRVAEVYGLSEGNFSRKLRRELPPQEQRKILEIINHLAEEDLR